MSDDDRTRWNRRYSQGAYGAREHPSIYLRTRVAGISQPASNERAFDVACGAGRNTRFLAQRGFAVDAADVSDVALERAAERCAGIALPTPINWHCVDLDAELPTSFDRYALIAVVRYLDTALVTALCARLAIGGHLIAEVHLQSAALTPPGPVGGPGSNRFRAAPGALRAAATTAATELLDHFEGLVHDPDGKLMALARVHVQRVR